MTTTTAVELVTRRGLKMTAYRVKPGFTFGAQSQHKPGDVVELTKEEAAGFLDKLEIVESSVSKPDKPVRSPASTSKGRKAKVKDGE